MPNKNYLAGRRFEYEVMRAYEEMGYKTLRTAGSHGEFDVVAYHPHSGVIMIQCKVVESEKAVKKLVEKFLGAMPEEAEYTQVIEVRVKGKKQVYTYAV